MNTQEHLSKIDNELKKAQQNIRAIGGDFGIALCLAYHLTSAIVCALVLIAKEIRTLNRTVE